MALHHLHHLLATHSAGSADSRTSSSDLDADLDVEVVTKVAVAAAKVLMGFRTVLNSNPVKDLLKMVHSETPHPDGSGSGGNQGDIVSGGRKAIQC